MNSSKSILISKMIESNCLLFGNFTLKSGIESPYFFNATFDSAELLSKVAKCYAKHLYAEYGDNLTNFTLFGAAYKGIPLVVAIGMALVQDYNVDCNIVFNRKEPKDHGEGGSLVGKIKNNDIILIDDVLTRGTALLQVIKMIQLECPSSSISRAVILLDRMEKVEDSFAKVCLEKTTGVQIDALLCVLDIMDYLETENIEYFEKMKKSLE
eukprot:NODE_138_length_16264_cov_1.140860.p10 type:complete len:211 gc:universal NODE_138_length_16264_cov_1.140860:11156-11788(+)